MEIKIVDYQIREIKENEYPILSDFLYEAIFVPYAAAMYRKAGFEVVAENEEEYIMVCPLQ